ncbi:MAG TPA: sigma-54 dependent transcriptional regulator [Planctomycetota bacterium]|jgi:DNA-binding NtrC family response regulator|nr:sigma-54-dependent Fis family transcriptional regulator [Planctomycetota bacterium]OQC20730.1 MAG: Transcriptional regulatory protein ZraR [Planctomycetes bacterium ADurb.Bin069]HNR98341.1 sigma-54 dependent transcriptional regulator [Planctomycetota bacterium]HNU24659.1 sigma-54 dependent transcriptional regulator [Planctomycetota bacterium]HOE28947.1 sigma-54 dependent transcriptional regulator [Planctomycetota bacterium]
MSVLIFVVEDDARQREIIAKFLEGRGLRVRAAGDAEGALALLEEEAPDLVLMDVRMPGMGGLEGLARMRARLPALPVILLTAYAEVRDAVEAIKKGAADYLEKPVDLHELMAVIEDLAGPREERGKEAPPPLPEGFVAAGPAMARVVREADMVAPTDATVLITGESGSGKEKIAALIHARSARAAGPFVAVNCAAIPRTLVESELFGHVKGAFTGADANRSGRFETATGGTLLLDEIGELPLDVQPKLLRVLEDGAYERLGESRTRRADARIIACTNRDLEKEAAAGRFREDLFWRLNVFHIRVPPLRERPEDVPELARLFLRRAGKEKARLSPATQALLAAYGWPGNVRELANVIERAAILSAGAVILPEHLPEKLRASAAPPPARPDRTPVVSVEEAERLAIREALRRTGGNRTEAAALLGISRRTLFYRLKQYGGEP